MKSDNQAVLLINETTETLGAIAKNKTIYFLSPHLSEVSINGKGAFWDERIAPTPWQSSADITFGWRTIGALHDELLPRVCNALNQIHQTEYSEDDWNLLLGSWLWQCITILVDRWKRIEIIEDMHDVLELEGRALNTIIIPKTSAEAFYLATTDAYNANLVKKIFQFKGHNVQAVVKLREDKANYLPKSNKTKQILKRIVRILSSFQPTFLKHVTLHETYLSKNSILRLKLSFILGIRLTFRDDALRFSDDKICPTKRKIFAKLMRDQNSQIKDKSVGSFISTEMHNFIPSVFIEEFQLLKESAQAKASRNCVAVCSAGGWHNDEPFKHYALFARRNGAKLVGIQHGGTYLTFNEVPHFKFESEILDRLYAWGKETKGKKNIKPAIYPKERSINQGHSKQADDILFFMSYRPRYLTALNFASDPRNIADMINSQYRFFSALSDETLQRTRIRQPDTKFGWPQDSFFKEFYKLGLGFADGSIPIHKALASARVSIVDTLSTVWLESIAFNNPTIIIGNFNVDISSKVNALLGELQKLSVVHLSPESAAHFLNHNYGQLAEWWSDDNVQEIRSKICNLYIDQSRNEFDFWKKALAPDQFKSTLQGDEDVS